MSTAKLAIALLITAIAAIALSNTVGDGNLFGSIMFFVWVLALLALIGLGVRALVPARTN